ncbi:MAG: phytoene/squalene synthase family protein [Armatimonadota bacterium]|nr:phytoene/squalene synthase family protein [bacterium]
MTTISPARLRESYRYCRSVAKKRAKNFYYSFIVLPREKSDAMCAVYAFMRYCDDIADDPTIGRNRNAMLNNWRESLDECMLGNYGDSLILPAFHDAVTRFDIPPGYLHQLIDGATMDLSIDRYRTFDELYDYCYKVASVVGLVCIHIFGFDSPQARRHAEFCGIAFQLTNILRDVKEDAERGRVYLPEEDLWAFDYSADDLTNGVYDDRFQRLMKFETRRAYDYYSAALPLVMMVHGSGRPGLCAMIEIYSSILGMIDKNPGDVLDGQISLPTTRKLSIAARAIMQSRMNGGRPFLPELRL